MQSLKEEINLLQVFSGIVFLIIGTLFYFFFRSPEHTYFLKFLGGTPQLKYILPNPFVSLGNSLPTFTHVLAFSLITAGLIANRKRGYAIICLAWFLVDMLFELGQGLDKTIIKFIPDWFSKVLFLENTKNYFLYGKLDFADLLSIGLGSVAAYVILIFTMKKKEGGHGEKTVFNY